MALCKADPGVTRLSRVERRGCPKQILVMIRYSSYEVSNRNHLMQHITSYYYIITLQLTTFFYIGG